MSLETRLTCARPGGRAAVARRPPRWPALAALVLHCMAAPLGAAEGETVRVEKVEVRGSPAGPVVLLRAGNRAVPIFVDFTVAESIQSVLSGRKPPRPLSHDLMHGMLQGLEARVSQVVITLKGDTYHGAVTLVGRDLTRVFDSRSSDAIALAIHFKAPILVSPALLDSAGVEVEETRGKRL